MTYRSPLLQVSGAVAADGLDSGVAAHYGNPVSEQRRLVDGSGWVDLSHRDVVAVAGPDRLPYLHAMTTQGFADLAPGVTVDALLLSPQGHIEHAFRGVDDGERFLGHTEAGEGAGLVAFLEAMKFMMRVEISQVTEDFAVVHQGTSGDLLLERTELPAYATTHGPACGVWAREALRIAEGRPRIGLDSDHRTIPNELGLLGHAVQLDKGCYRGQETVARVHNLGRPPRRLVLLHLDGSVNHLPPHGAAVTASDRVVGSVGSSARHHELGPIALALVKRNIPLEATLLADGVPAAQEAVVDPEIGLHVRPALR
ncbi:MAG: folate-binding protein YgfZ [Nocardioidaceae bacterium]|nr:folate-binding protein YgfZ [Nocardioidaceae bacterium]